MHCCFHCTGEGGTGNNTCDVGHAAATDPFFWFARAWRDVSIDGRAVERSYICLPSIRDCDGPLASGK